MMWIIQTSRNVARTVFRCGMIIFTQITTVKLNYPNGTNSPRVSGFRQAMYGMGVRNRPSDITSGGPFPILEIALRPTFGGWTYVSALALRLGSGSNQCLRDRSNYLRNENAADIGYRHSVAPSNCLSTNITSANPNGTLGVGKLALAAARL